MVISHLSFISKQIGPDQKNKMYFSFRVSNTLSFPLSIIESIRLDEDCIVFALSITEH